jgi:hypothetical protein
MKQLYYTYFTKLVPHRMFVDHETITLSSAVTLDCLGQKALWTVYGSIDMKILL